MKTRSLDKKRVDGLPALSSMFVEKTRRIKELESERQDIRKAIESALDALGRDDITSEHNGEVYRAQRYPLRRASYDVAKLGKLLRSRGLEGVLKVTVDETKLMDAVERGLVSLEEVNQYAKVSTSFGFRVDKVKK